MGFAALAAAQGSLQRAATLFGAADALQQATAAFQRAYFERHIADARSRTPEGEWAAAWEAGRAMGVEGAISYARQSPGG
jgi:hypothetical protein